MADTVYQPFGLFRYRADMKFSDIKFSVFVKNIPKYKFNTEFISVYTTVLAKPSNGAHLEPCNTHVLFPWILN
jgi:hypothetical protein